MKPHALTLLALLCCALPGAAAESGRPWVSVEGAGPGSSDASAPFHRAAFELFGDRR